MGERLVISERRRANLSSVICHFIGYRLLAIGYWLLVILPVLLEPGAVIHVDRDEKQDAFDQV